MGTSKIARRLLPLSFILAGILAGWYLVSRVGGSTATPLATVQAANLPGMASLSGTVESPRPFKAGQVYIRNVDKRILYMVYTNAGKFRAVQLFPGNYEVSVTAKGFTSDVQKLAVKAGENPTVKVTLKEVAASGNKGSDVNVMSGVEDADQRADVTFVSYEEAYPPGPGRDVAEQVCMLCHGENFFPGRPTTEAIWNARIDHMTGKQIFDRPAESYAEGMLSYRAQFLRWSLKDREDLVAYLVKNFGPGSARRVIRTDKETPLDEAKLAKAMYMEYYLPVDPPGKGVNDPQYGDRKKMRSFSQRRTGQDIRFDADGNVWMTDRGYPVRLNKLDPRTGEMKEWITPNPTHDIHEVLVGRDGMVWLPEHAFDPGQRSFLLGFNPKTEKWEYNVDMDPNDVIRNAVKWGQSFAMDSKNNLYIGWIMGGALTKFDYALKKVTDVFPIPITDAVPYGLVSDRDDNIWVALWAYGALAKFDTRQKTWSVHTPPTFPSQIRRPNVDPQNNIWTGIWAAGSKRAGRLIKLDQTTNKWTEYPIPEQNAMPYDVNPDHNGNVWFVDSPAPDRSASIGVFNTKDQSFTFYPKPQFDADTPKIQVTKDGAIWYSPRGSRRAPGFGVLYPDMDKITTLGASYVNGPPGYPFK